MHDLSGGCHCGNILLDLRLVRPPGTYSPRACDCDFCRKHSAAYLSDPQGTLLIRIKNQRDSGRYRQGSGIAEFLLCRNCGVLVGVLHRGDGPLHAAVNVRAVDLRTTFRAEQPVSPKLLSAAEKAARWRDVWFARVSIVDGDA